jgi:hypothetical protein
MEREKVWSVNRLEIGRERVAGGFFNAAGLAGFVSTRDRSISKMSGC